MFRIPMDNLCTHNLFSQFLKEKYPEMSRETHIIVAPDAGAAKRCRDLSYKLGLDMVMIEKRRSTTQINTIDSMFLIESENTVKGKIAFIYDDMADTMGTMCKTCELLGNKGVINVIAVITHPILSGSAIDRLGKCDILTKLICCNTLPVPSHSKIEVCDISESIATAINCLETGESMSHLFE